MGIKTRFNPMGGPSGKDIPSAWSYTTETDGTRTLYFYNNTIGGDIVTVPNKKTQLQDYHMSRNNSYATLPFLNHKTLTSVDLKNVPFKNDKMSNAFSYCTNLVEVKGLNSSITNMSYTFDSCSNLNQNIQIPNSVTNMSYTFDSCSNLNQNIQIPNSVTNMSGTFFACYNLNQNIQIPNSVTNMSVTFYICHNIGSDSKTINILSAEISNAFGCFWGTSSFNMSNQLTVLFPMRYINNVNTLTRNSLVTAGYAVGTGVGNTTANATGNINLKCWDLIPYQGFNTYTGNGTHWVLTKWNGKSGELGTNVTIPTSITSYDTFPTAITKATFTANKLVTGIDCNNVPFDGTAVDTAFTNCVLATYINNINIPDGVTTVKDLVSHDAELIKLSTDSGTDYTANLDLPDSVVNTQAVFARTKKISNYYLNSNSSTTLAYAMDYVNVTPWNLYVKSPNVASVTNFCRGSNTAIRKNIYIYYKYANGVATKTFNVFKPALYTGTTGNSGSTSPMYNATSNFYIYNLGTCPV